MGKIYVNGTADMAEIVANLTKEGLNYEVIPGNDRYDYVITIKGY